MNQLGFNFQRHVFRLPQSSSCRELASAVAGAALLLFAGLACSRDDGGPEKGAATPGSAIENAGDVKVPTKTTKEDLVASSDAVSKAIGAAVVLPRLVTAGVLSSRSMIVEAVYFATGQTGAGQLGQITSTGTIQVSQLGAVYSPSPEDRLVVILDQQTHEFKLSKAEGNHSAGTADQWLNSAHLIDYEYKSNVGEARVSAQFDGRTFQVSVGGHASLGGQRFDVDLKATGGTQGEGDFNGRESKTQYQLTGTIRGAGLDIEVDETHTTNFASAYGLNLLYSQRGYASQVLCDVRSTVKSGKDSYRFDHVHIEAGTKERGGNTTGGLVNANGTILRNDAPLGTLVLDTNALLIQTAAGTIPLKLQ